MEKTIRTDRNMKSDKIDNIVELEKYKIAAQASIGHIHLTVNNMKDSLFFYKDILGFELKQHMGGAAFLSAGGYHHHIALNIWGSEYAQEPEEGQIGLYHFAILFPNRKELAKAVKNIVEYNYPIYGSADHGVSASIYLEDPDGNGLELYYDKPKEEWPVDKEGKLSMFTRSFDVGKLLIEADL
jgi:catechol 2,3-dioxygenase